LSAGHELGFSAFRSDAKVDFVGTFADTTKPVVSAYSLYSDHQFTQIWHARLSLSEGSDDLDSLLGGTSVARFRTTHLQLSWNNEVSLTPEQTLTAGAERKQERIASRTPVDRTERGISSIYAGYIASLGRHALQLNVRLDDYPSFGTHATGLAGYGYTLAPGWRANLNISSAYRAPSLSDLYDPFSGNPQLKPEQARSLEAGLQFAAGPHLARAVYFHTRISDLINFIAPTFQAVNVDRSHTSGLEFSYTGRFPEGTLKASVTAQDPVDDSTGQALLRRAKLYGSLSALRRQERWTFSAEVIASGARMDGSIIDFGTRVRLGGYAVANAAAEYTLNRNTRFALRLENLLDKDYELAHGYNVRRRAFMATLEYRAP
jgi:vitamin B12 transporter